MLLAIRVSPLLLMLVPLHSVKLLSRLSHGPLFAFLVAVIEDLLAAVMLLLKRPESLLLLSLLFKELLLDELLISLVQNNRLLLVI